MKEAVADPIVQPTKATGWYVLIFCTAWFTWVQSTLATMHSMYRYMHIANNKQVKKCFMRLEEPPPIGSHLM